MDYQRLSLKEWIDEKLESAKEKGRAVVAWGGEHKDTLMTFGPIVAGGLIEIVKISAKKKLVKEERKLKEQFVYDRPHGHSYETRRKVKSAEWLQIDQRRDDGEPLGRILSDMDLLKK